LQLRLVDGADPPRRQPGRADLRRVHQLPDRHAERDRLRAPAGLLMGTMGTLLLLALMAAPLPMPPPPPPAREAWPLAEISLGGSVLTRGAAFCAAPLQPWCGKDASLVYSTELPYVGGAARATVFPFAHNEAVEWRGLGFEGRYFFGATY